MNKNRKAKKGFIYILESKDKKLMKYGASINPKLRVRHINYSFKENPFHLVATYESNDIFRDECKIKWDLWDHGILMEIFHSTKYSKEYLLNLSQKICECKGCIYE